MPMGQARGWVISGIDGSFGTALYAGMPRQLRLESPGAMDHVISRGDRREKKFRSGQTRHRPAPAPGDHDLGKADRAPPAPRHNSERQCLPAGRFEGTGPSRCPPRLSRNLKAMTENTTCRLDPFRVNGADSLLIREIPCVRRLSSPPQFGFAHAASHKCYGCECGRSRR